MSDVEEQEEIFGLKFLFELTLIFGIIFFLYLKNFPLPPPTFGIYRRRGKFFYLKLLTIYTVLKLRKFLERKKTKLNLQNYENMDKPQPLSENIHAIDAVYFNGSYKDKSTLVCGTARRKDNLVNGFLFLRVPEFNEKLLLSPRLPDTCMIQKDDELDYYKVEGLFLSPITPMKSWNIEYKGKMRFDNSIVNGDDEEVDVDLKATFTAKTSIFNYDTDMEPFSMANALAREPWTKEYFENLKNYHQTHYEQYGDINGSVAINNRTYPFFVNSVRDHSFGEQRDWKNFHRYALHFFTLENGDRITIGVVCMPVTFSRIEIGFINIASEGKNYPIEKCDIQLYQHGELKDPPRDYAFTFQARGKRYTTKVKVYDRPEFFLGTSHECRVVEQLCYFDVNGIKGWGAAEWQYRHLKKLY